MARLWIGTSGWNYKHWRERFYPKDVPVREWLAHYAGRFPTVEVNNSFYRQPKETNWDTWRETAPKGFRFAVKAHRFLTHRRRLKDCEDPLERVLKGARRLEEKLGPLLFQLPPYFKRTQEYSQRLEAFLDLLPAGLMYAFEFRDESWFGEETLEQLRHRNVAFCSYDMVKVDCPLVATARFAYMRFHGSGVKYGGNYSDSELRKWAGRLGELSPEVDEVYVYFNNDAQGYAVANALKLAELLSAPMPQPALSP